MKDYPVEVIDALARYIKEGKATDYNIIAGNNFPELLLLQEVLKGHDSAIEHLIKNDHFIIAAFASAIWNDDKKAIDFLIKQKAPQWVAAAFIVGGKEEAKISLKKFKLEHYIRLAEEIKAKIKGNEKSDLEYLFKGPY